MNRCAGNKLFTRVQNSLVRKSDFKKGWEIVNVKRSFPYWITAISFWLSQCFEFDNTYVLQPFVEIREARHPCVIRTFGGGDFIPNDTVIGIPDVSLQGYIIPKSQTSDNDSLYKLSPNWFLLFFNTGTRQWGGRWPEQQ